MQLDDLTGLVRYVVAGLHKAGHLKGYDYGDEDILQEGMVGALEALKTHNADKGAVSTHLVPRIRGRILDYIGRERNGGMASKRKALCLVSLDEDVSTTNYCEIVTYDAEQSSSAKDSITYEDSAFNHTPPQFKQPEQRVLQAQVLRRVGYLPQPYREAIERTFGVRGKDAIRAAELARQSGVTQSAIAKRVERALSWLRSDFS